MALTTPTKQYQQNTAFKATFKINVVYIHKTKKKRALIFKSINKNIFTILDLKN